MKKEYTYSMPDSFIRDQAVPVRWRILGIINGFSIAGKGCYASNEWFATELDCSERTISNGFKELEDSGEIYCVRTKRSRIAYRITSEIATNFYLRPKPTSISDRNQLLPISDIISDNNTYGLRPFVEEVQISEEEERPRVDRRTRDKEAIYRLFSEKPQPWWRHKAQRDAALSLFDMVGIEKVKAGIEFMREHADDKFCPQASTPFEYEQKMPKLKQYAKRKNT